MGRASKQGRAFDEATDMTGSGAYADIVVPPQAEGDSLGQTKNLQTQVDAVKSTMGPEGMVPASLAKNAITSPVNIGGATDRMLEPITTGVPIGAGSNGTMPLQTNTLHNFLLNAKRLTQDPVFDELLSGMFEEEEQIMEDNPQDFFGL
tara:strand:+ start:233 stop:679 length:447 start_codon:yes stop_codon:yes gene_type:complete